MQDNTDKCHLLLSTVEKVTMDVQYSKKKKQSEKFLGIKNLCKKTSSKIHALARVAPYMNMKRMTLP